mmetsp:Transcript_2744/g.8998  ORF Transcript_2744/g.8998 Transcript_2744/m.8998 type:complete len:326 (+) Transcript_2744:181-1158(+)
MARPSSRGLPLAGCHSTLPTRQLSALVAVSRTRFALRAACAACAPDASLLHGRPSEASARAPVLVQWLVHELLVLRVRLARVGRMEDVRLASPLEPPAHVSIAAEAGEGEHSVAVLGEHAAAGQRGGAAAVVVYHRNLHHHHAKPLQQLGASKGGAAGREDVVHDHDGARARGGEEALVQLEAPLSVVHRHRIGLVNGRRQLPRLPNGKKGDAERLCHRRSEQEPARLGRRHRNQPRVLVPRHQRVNAEAERGGVGEERRHVPKDKVCRRETAHGPDERLDPRLEGSQVCPARRGGQRGGIVGRRRLRRRHRRPPRRRTMPRSPR